MTDLKVKDMALTVPLEIMWVDVGSKGEESLYYEKLLTFVRAICETITDDTLLKTRELLDAWGLDKIKAVHQVLWRLRVSGDIEDCYMRDPRRRFMGNALILWRKPTKVEVDVKAF